MVSSIDILNLANQKGRTVIYRASSVMDLRDSISPLVAGLVVSSSLVSYYVTIKL